MDDSFLALSLPVRSQSCNDLRSGQELFWAGERTDSLAKLEDTFSDSDSSSSTSSSGSVATLGVALKRRRQRLVRSPDAHYGSHENGDAVPNDLTTPRKKDNSCRSGNKTSCNVSEGQTRRILKDETFECNSMRVKSCPKSLSFDSGKPAKRQSMNSSRKQVFTTSHDNMAIPESTLPRETIASRLRYERQHSHHTCPADTYQTPMQRKDALIKSLKLQVRELQSTLNEKDAEFSLYKESADEEMSRLMRAKDRQIESLHQELKRLRESHEDMSAFCEESLSAAARLEKQAEDLTAAMDERERQHEKIYLEMYKKGQNSAKFEREEELEHLASAGGCKVTISELVKKLAWTEVELAKWQTIQRDEIYRHALQPETAIDATFQFLKDSFYHYLIDSKDSDQHLLAMIKIFRFSETQLKRIQATKTLEKIKKNTAKSK